MRIRTSIPQRCMLSTMLTAINAVSNNSIFKNQMKLKDMLNYYFPAKN